MTTDSNPIAARAAAQDLARQWIATPGLLILDTETTGLDNQAEIVQIAAIWLSDGSTAFDSLVRPTRPIPPAATAIHGITDADVADAPTFAELAQPLWSLLVGNTTLIYNESFDTRLITQSLAAHGIDAVEWGNGMRFLDVLAPYSAWCGEWSEYHGNYRWQRLPGGDHTALGDCRATREAILDMADLPEEYTITIRLPRSQRYRWKTDRRTVESFAAVLCAPEPAQTARDQTLQYLTAAYRACLFGPQTTAAHHHPEIRDWSEAALGCVRRVLAAGNQQTKAEIFAALQRSMDRLDTRRKEIEAQIRREQRG